MKLFTVFNHIIMSTKLEKVFANKRVYSKEATLENLNLFKKGDFSVDLMSKYLKNQKHLVKGYLFFEKDTDEPVGYAWIMRKGGNEVQYRVRRTDFFLFDLCVFQCFRGQGFASEFLSYIATDLINNFSGAGKYLSLAVRVNNIPAIKVYKKFGFLKVERKKFVRLLKINFPYYSV